MLLAIDVGNTNVTMGVFDRDRLVHSWRLAALRERTADEMGIFVKGLFEQSDVELSTVTGIALASVVPPLTRPMEEMADRYFKLKPLTVDATNAGMPVHYSPVGDVGADRIVNAVAAWEQFGRARSRSVDRRGLRHGHDLRRHLASRRISRWRDLSWHRDLR